jgi:hypothetical protein
VISHIEDVLKIDIPTGHRLDFTITPLPGQTRMVTISSFGNSFAFFRNGASSVTGTVHNTGKVSVLER